MRRQVYILTATLSFHNGSNLMVLFFFFLALLCELGMGKKDTK